MLSETPALFRSRDRRATRAEPLVALYGDPGGDRQLHRRRRTRRVLRVAAEATALEGRETVRTLGTLLAEAIRTDGEGA